MTPKINPENCIYGIHAVKMLLEKDSANVEKLYVLHQRNDAKLQDIRHLAHKNNILIEELTRQELDQLAHQANHQGVIAICQNDLPRKIFHEKELEILFQHKENPLVLILDGIQDPHNLGACLRTANVAGVDAVIIPKDRSAPLNATVRKVASGAADETILISVTNLARTMRALKEQNFWIYGLAGEASENLYQTKFSGAVALVLGGEEKGLRQLTREECDVLISIPQFGNVESLNVSVACGIALFEVVRQKNL